MPFSPKLLNENEDVVLDLHPHWVYFLKSALLFLAAVAHRRPASSRWDGAPDVLGHPERGR